MMKRRIKAVFVVALIAVFVALVYAFVFALCKVSGETNDEYEAEVTEATPEAKPDAFVRYPLPLSDGLQRYIVRVCLVEGVAPSVVFAVIERESNCKADAIGDNGNSYGLMQIWKSWHEDRMRALGCSDLLNPYENVRVGINILGELLSKYDIETALSYYSGNGGAPCEYAKAVMDRAEEIEEGAMVIQK